MPYTLSFREFWKLYTWCKTVYRAAYGPGWEERFARLTVVDAVRLYREGAGVPLT